MRFREMLKYTVRGGTAARAIQRALLYAQHPPLWWPPGWREEFQASISMEGDITVAGKPVNATRSGRMAIRRLLLPLSLSLLIVFVAGLCWNQWTRYRESLPARETPATREPLDEGEPPDIVVSPETTYITEPLAEDGLPDYKAYVQNKYGKDVTPENNAVVSVWHAIGPGPIPEKSRAELFGQLGIEALPLEGDYYVRTNDADFVASGVAWLLPLWGIHDVPVAKPGDDATDAAIDEETQQVVEEAGRVFVTLVLMAPRYPWQPENFPLVCQWIEDNHRPLQHAHTASNRSRFYPGYAFPEWPSSPRSLNEVHFQAVHLGRGLAIRAVWHIAEKRFHEAQQDILAIYRLAQLVSQGLKCTDVYDAARNLSYKACRANIVLASDPDAPIAVLKRSFHELRNLPRWNMAADIMDEGERLLTLDALLELYRHPGDPTLRTRFGRALSEHLADRSALNMNILMRETNKTFDQVAHAMRLPDREARAASLQAIEDGLVPQDPLLVAEIRTARGRKARSQMIAKMLHRLLGQNIRICLVGDQRSSMRLDLTTLAMALAVYRGEHGTFPKALGQLVPDLLDAVPFDRFTGDPLRYERRGNGYLLYSVGADGTDDGGNNSEGTIVDGEWTMKSGYRETGNPYDIVIRVPMAPLEASWLWPFTDW